MIHFQKDLVTLDGNIIIAREDIVVKFDPESKGVFTNNFLLRGEKTYKQHYDLAVANTFFKRLIFGFKLIFSIPQRVKYNVAKLEA